MRRTIVTILALCWSAGLAACSEDEPGGVPDPPTELSVELDASIGVVLTWSDAEEEKDYVVKRQVVGVDSGFVVIAELPADTVEYKDIKVASGKTHRYQVLSENPYGESASEEVTIDVP